MRRQTHYKKYGVWSDGEFIVTMTIASFILITIYSILERLL